MADREFIVGNPPFIGKGVRQRLVCAGDALWAAHPQMNESADFVMYWWDRAAELLDTKRHHAPPLWLRHNQLDHSGVQSPGRETGI